MRAAVLRDYNKLVLEDVPEPTPGFGEVVVRVKSCGFCATDYKAIKGIRRNVTFPLIPGHEPAGIVAKLGAGVQHFREGDEVIVMPAAFCGVCEHCRSDFPHYCENAYTTGGDGMKDVRPGAFAEYMKTSAGSLFRKPRNVSFDAGALTEPLAGAWKGLIRHSEMKVGDDVVIIGVGGIGLLCLMVAKAAGAGRLIAIDPSEYALSNAKRLGATHLVNLAKTDAKKAVDDIIPNGPDLVVEAAGPIEAVQLTAALRRRGTKWNVFGITTHEKFWLDGGETHFLEGRMDASFGCTPVGMSNAIRLMERGLVNPEEIVSHRFQLAEIHAAVEVMSGAERNKVIIHP
jgi:L-iditol 2-dehydrogenase